MVESGLNGKNGSYSGANNLRLKLGLAEMLKGGVIMDVMNVEQARIAEEAGAVAVMALERVPAMIRAEGGVARMANPKLIKQIIETVSIPVMAKARIGHFAEAQILQYLGVDFVDESEVLTPADEAHQADHRDGLDPGHGQGPHRPLCRSANPAVSRRRLRRRVRSTHPRR